MKAWEKEYDDEVLNEAKDLAGNVEIIRFDGVEVIAKIESFEVTTYIQYSSPTFVSCNCSKGGYCKHGAALVYYLMKHPELLSDEDDFKEIFDRVDDNRIRRFLFNELESNEELKNRFLGEFQENSIDKTYYRNKLSRVFKTGEPKEFEYHEMYDLDLMEDSLYDFIFDDISNVLSAGEYDFACELLCRIADVLNDEVMSTYDSWDNLVDRFMEQVNVLSTSIYLDSEKLNQLYSKMNVIFDIY